MVCTKILRHEVGILQSVDRSSRVVPASEGEGERWIGVFSRSAAQACEEIANLYGNGIRASWLVNVLEEVCARRPEKCDLRQDAGTAAISQDTVEDGNVAVSGPNRDVGEGERLDLALPSSADCCKGSERLAGQARNVAEDDGPYLRWKCCMVGTCVEELRRG